VFRRERIVIEVGATGNLPAFNAGLVGATAKSRREFPVAYPAEYEARHLAGRTVQYVVTVHEVKRSELPALDDEFAKDLGEFDSLATLRARVRDDLGERKRAEARQAVRNAVLDRLLLENPVPLPETLVEAEIRHRLEDLVRTMVMQGIDPQNLEVNWKEVRDRQVEPARRAVHARLLLDRVARAETLAVDPADVDARIRHDAERTRQDWREVRRRLQQGGGMEALQTQLVREKSLDFITSVANIQREG
jgi:trigger factor